MRKKTLIRAAVALASAIGIAATVATPVSALPDGTYDENAVGNYGLRELEVGTVVAPRDLYVDPLVRPLHLSTNDYMAVAQGLIANGASGITGAVFARLDRTGQYDPTFNSGAPLVVDLPTGEYYQVGMEVADDGTMFYLVRRVDSTATYVVKVTAAGALDTSWGASGFLDPGVTNAVFTAMYPLSSSVVYLAAIDNSVSPTGHDLVRLANGAIDTSFGGDGKHEFRGDLPNWPAPGYPTTLIMPRQLWVSADETKIRLGAEISYGTHTPIVIIAGWTVSGGTVALDTAGFNGAGTTAAGPDIGVLKWQPLADDTQDLGDAHFHFKSDGSAYILQTAETENAKLALTSANGLFQSNFGTSGVVDLPLSLSDRTRSHLLSEQFSSIAIVAKKGYSPTTVVMIDGTGAIDSNYNDGEPQELACNSYASFAMYESGDVGQLDVDVSGDTDSWVYSLNANGGSSGTCGQAPVSSPGPSTPQNFIEPESVTAVLGADGVTVTISGVPSGLESLSVRVSPTSWEPPYGPSNEPYYAWFNAAPADADWLDEADGVVEVVDGVITLVVPNLTLEDGSSCDYMDMDSFPACIVTTTEEFSVSTAYRISYSAAGEDSDGRWRMSTFDEETETQNYVAVTSGGASDDTASDDTASDDTASDDTASDDTASDESSTTTTVVSGVVAPGEGAVSSQVAESNASTFVRNPGEVSLVDSDGNPVIGELVRVSDAVGSVPAGARTAEQVAQIRSEAQAMVAALEERLPDGVSSPVSVVETESGANISGLVTDPADDTSDLPVPAEDVVLLVTEEQALLIGGADGPADPADVRNGVLEIGPDGEVSALAYGLTPGASGELVVMSSPTLLGTFTVGADGSFQGQAALPSTLAAGSHTVVLAADGLVASAGVVVTGGVTLPVTGGESSSVPWAVLVVAAGALAVLVIRRRVVV